MRGGGCSGPWPLGPARPLEAALIETHLVQSMAFGLTLTLPLLLPANQGQAS